MLGLVVSVPTEYVSMILQMIITLLNYPWISKHIGTHRPETSLRCVCILFRGTLNTQECARVT